MSLFYEDSTRTRLSFETAAKRLSADTMTFSVSTSSVKKGESIRDTVQTIEAMGVDAIVVRHQSAGVPWQIAGWASSVVINGGDGWHEHPTQALLDCYTIRQHLGSLEGKRVAIVGDIKHSRVARSDVLAFTLLGAEVTLVAPPTLLPPSLDGWPVSVSNELEEVLPKIDVVYLLRMQSERQSEALLPSLREYTARFGLTQRRAQLLGPDTIVMHPGPDEPGRRDRGRGRRPAQRGHRRPGAQRRRRPHGGACSCCSARARNSKDWTMADSAAETIIKGGRVHRRDGRTRGRCRARSRRSGAHRRRRSSTRDGATVLDATGCIVAPGLVDLHTHLREPGREEAETVETGSRAAALGGFTALVAMPNTDPDARLGRGGARGARLGQVRAGRRARRRRDHDRPAR